MKIEMLKTEEIKPYEKNPRDNAPAIKVVIASIKKFKFLDPIELDEDKVILAGHTRYLAAKKLKLKAIPVIIHEGMTPEQKKAYRIANNSTGEVATWNNELLKMELTGIKIDMGKFGLDLKTLTQAIQDSEIEGLLKKFEDLQPKRKTAEQAQAGGRLRITITGGKEDFTPKILKFLKGLYAIGAKVEIEELE